ncbi:MAG: hypothetical protein ACXWLM_07560 [Myxococcales bacterium]
MKASAGTRREVLLTAVFLGVFLTGYLAVDGLVPVSTRPGIVAGCVAFTACIASLGLRRLRSIYQVAIVVAYAAALAGSGWIDVSGKPPGRKEFARKLYALPGVTRHEARAAMAGYRSSATPNQDRFQYSATEADIGVVIYDGDRVTAVEWWPD